MNTRIRALGLGLCGLWMASAAAAQVTNGGFEENGLAGWTATGGVAAVAVTPTNHVAVLAEPSSSAPGAGGRNQIEQEFTIPTAEPGASPPPITFVFLLDTHGGPRPPALPPDSFQAFLLDPATGDPLVGGTNLIAGKAFLYVDSDHPDDSDFWILDGAQLPGGTRSVDGMKSVLVPSAPPDGVIGFLPRRRDRAPIH